MKLQWRSVLAIGLALFVASAASAVPFWGAKEPQPAGTDPAALKPGEFLWKGDAVPSGPIVVVVSLTEQRAYVYRNGIRIGVATASTGKPGHGTPTGVFTILQKDADHHSKTYNNAAMPFTERLTWDGVALHAGGLPGYPSSHGCVHLPSAFAKLLFQISPMGMTVVIAAEHEAPADVVHPAAIAPVDAKTGAAVDAPRLGANEDERWQPEKSPDGPVSILMSGADRRVLVYRNGVEIGRAKLEIRDPQLPLGTHAFTMLDADGAGAKPRWIAIGIPGHAEEANKALDPAQADRVSMPPPFRSAVAAILGVGATLIVTDAPVLEQTTGVALNIINGDPPELDTELARLEALANTKNDAKSLAEPSTCAGPSASDACLRARALERIAFLRASSSAARSEDAKGISVGPVVFDCEKSDGPLTITFVNGDVRMAYATFGKQAIVFEQVPSGSGARYQGDGPEQIFWTKGDAAQFRANAESPEVSCKVAPTG